MDSEAGPSETQLRRRKPLSKDEKNIIWKVYDGLKQTLPTNEAVNRSSFLTGASVSKIEHIVREKKKKAP